MPQKVDWRKLGKPLYPPATDADLQAAENALARKLPEDLLLFLRETNGALFRDQPQYTIQRPQSAGGFAPSKPSLVRIYGVTQRPETRDYDSIQGNQNSYGFDEELPPKYLAIGHLFNHAVLCMSLEGDDKGWIYHWEPAELGAVDDTPPTKYLYPVGKNLNEFLDSLEEDPVMSSVK